MRAEIQIERFEMGVKQYRPTSPGRRFQTVSDKAEITCDKPEKSLLAPLNKKAGRNNHSHITVRHQGGGVSVVAASSTSSATRTACLQRSLPSSTTRTAPLVSLCCTTLTARSATSFIPKGLKVGDMIVSGADVDIKPGNAMPLSPSPSARSSMLSSCSPWRRAAHSAGTSIQLMGQGGQYAILRMPSEMRRVLLTLPRHHRRGRQRRALQHHDRQGRP